MKIDRRKKPLSEKHKEKLRQAKLKNPNRYWLGKKRPGLKNTNAIKTMFKKGQLSFNKGKKLSEEHKRKLSISHKGQKSAIKGKRSSYRGEKHWNWKGGIANIDRMERVRFTKYFQKKILKRDNYTCQICQIKGGDLQVDHIKLWAEYPNLRFNLKNCRTVCVKCHYQITFNKPMPQNIRSWGHHFLQGGI